MLGERLQQDDCRKGFLLTRFPRNIEQAGWLDRMIAGTSSSGTVTVVILDELLRGRQSIATPVCASTVVTSLTPVSDGGGQLGTPESRTGRASNPNSLNVPPENRMSDSSGFSLTVDTCRAKIPSAVSVSSRASHWPRQV
jgi:hypothetical protein